MCDAWYEGRTGSNVREFVTSKQKRVYINI